jgi:hypothetical protein
MTVATTPVTTTTEASGVGPGAAAAAGAAAANAGQPPESSGTDWGWVAFGILAFGLIVGGIAWWWKGRRDKRAGASPA